MLKNRTLATHALAATLYLVAASSAWSQVKSPDSDLEWHKSPRPAIDQPERKQVDHYPPWVLYRDFSGAMLIVSLSTLMRSGVSLRSSLERALRYSSPWLSWHLREILTRLSRPNSSTFGDAFQTGVVNQYLEDRIQDAAERRNPVEAFVKIGVGSIDRLASLIEASASKLNSALLVICGLILGLMMGGFFATAMELQSGIAQQNSQISR